MYPIKTNNLVMTSGYGKRTYIYNGKKITDFHHGIDLVGGNDVVAVSSGIVVKTVKKGSKGGTMCLVRIQHEKYQTAYYHLKSESITVSAGDYVEKGQVIAKVGNTGKVTGKHLHFQIDKGSNKTSINPYDYVFGKKEVKGLKKGDHKVESARYVRTGAGTDYRIKKVAELTPDGQKHVVDKNPTADAQYQVGTIFTVYEFKESRTGSIWGRSPSGWICLISKNGTIYCSKV
ncbi:M23 family metallopeptidase [bacterium]|nr:M23 family metallopeptidase [bacterium]